MAGSLRPRLHRSSFFLTVSMASYRLPILSFSRNHWLSYEKRCKVGSGSGLFEMEQFLREHFWWWWWWWWWWQTPKTGHSTCQSICVSFFVFLFCVVIDARTYASPIYLYWLTPSISMHLVFAVIQELKGSHSAEGITKEGGRNWIWKWTSWERLHPHQAPPKWRPSRRRWEGTSWCVNKVRNWYSLSLSPVSLSLYAMDVWCKVDRCMEVIRKRGRKKEGTLMNRFGNSNPVYQLCILPAGFLLSMKQRISLDTNCSALRRKKKWQVATKFSSFWTCRLQNFKPSVWFSHFSFLWSY